MKTFAIADTHFGCHGLISDLRSGWATPEGHDEVLISAINRSVGKRDRLVILGDFCKHPRDMASYRQRLECKTVLFIMGNHDKPLPARKVFGEANVFDAKMLKVGGKLIWCSHYAHFFWPQSHYRSFHIYGHSHGEYERLLDNVMPGRRSMDVGVDNLFALRGSVAPLNLDSGLDHYLGHRPGHHL